MIEIVKFDEDVIEETQKIFDKYGMKFNYKDYIEDKRKKYKTAKQFCDYCCSGDLRYNDLIDCRKYRGLSINKYDSIIRFDDGFINKIYLPSLDYYDYSIRFIDSNKIDSIEDLDEQLGAFFKRLNSYVKMVKSKEFKNLLNLSKQKQEEKNKVIEECDSFNSKLTESMKKLESMYNDFNE